MAKNKQHSMYKTLAKDTGLFAISNFGSKILVFLLTPLYTSILTTTEFGIADLINTTIHFIYPIFTLAISDATLRYALDKTNSKSAVLNNSMLLTIASTVLLLLCYPLIGFLDETIKTYWAIFVVTYTLFNVHNCFSNFVKGIGKTTLFAIQGLVQTLAIIVFNILLLVVFKMGVNGYLLSTIIGYGIPILIMFFAGKIYLYWRPFKIDNELLKDMLKYSIPMIPTLLAWAINTSIDKYMIIGFKGLGESGIYSVSHKIPTILTTILSIFTQAWQLSAISNYGSKDESEYYTKIYKGLDAVSLIACMIIIGSSQWISKFLFADEFYLAWSCVPMLTISALFSSHAGFLSAAFRASKKTTSLFVSVVAGAGINIILNLLLINKLGVIGAAIGTASGFLVLWLIRIVMVQKIVNVKIKILTTVISYILMTVSALLISFEFKYSYAIFGISAFVIIILNFSQVKSVSSLVYGILKNKIKKKT